MAGVRTLLDVLCDRHPQEARESWLARVLCGDVQVDGRVERDPRARVRDEAVVVCSGERYVSRGGLKLDAAITAWQLPVENRVFVDAGASTGGFTDCLLRHGARAVHAVDVGYNLLDYRLRTDPRVVVHERTNIGSVRDLDPAPDAAVADLSFRSLRGIARRILDLTTERWGVFLVKPQFEWSDAPASFDGTVPEAEVRGVLLDVLAGLAAEGTLPFDLIASPVRGRRGNREYLVRCAADGVPVDPVDLVDRVIADRSYSRNASRPSGRPT